MKTTTFGPLTDSEFNQLIQKKVQPSLEEMPIKQIKHYIRYYATALTYSKFNFDYEPEYLEFITIRLKIYEAELEKRKKEEKLT